MSVLETPRLRLRLLHEEDEDDAALYMHLYTDAAVMQYIATPLTPATAASHFARVCRHNRAARPGHRTWRIDARATGADLGIAALRRAHDTAEVGVVLRAEAWGRGIGREAMAAVVDHAFACIGVDLLFGERPDDAQARLVDRMFAPLGLDRVPARTAGIARWELARERWTSVRGDGRSAAVAC